MSASNFDFLRSFEPELAEIGQRAEIYHFDDPDAACVKLRLLAEKLAKQVAARVGVNTDVSFFHVVNGLRDRGSLPAAIESLFDLVRDAGNRAAHEHDCTPELARRCVGWTRQLAGWYVRFDKPGFTTPPPVALKRPADREAEHRALIAELAKRLQTQKAKATEANEKAALAQEAAVAAKAQAAADRGDLKAALGLLDEVEQTNLRYEQKLANLEAQAKKATDAQQNAVVQAALDAGENVELDEDATRQLIDIQLREAGWEADSVKLHYAKGSRPQKGRNLAIAEWPTHPGFADYVLFRGLEAVAVVEAKRKNKDVVGVIPQAKRYSRDFKSIEYCVGGAPWGEYQIPFVFATNGRPYHRQIEEKSGIWFLDVRKGTNKRRPLQGWYSPEGLWKLLGTDAEASDQLLLETPNDLPGLRPYQLDAIRDVEKAIADGQREILVAMATGTGKTRTAISLIYRLVKAKRFSRVLFVVDRTALGDQATKSFKDVKLESHKSFTEIYDVKEIGEIQPESTTKLHFATVQGLVKRLLYNETIDLPVDTYDCIVIDECHRGYILDREMSDDEMVIHDLHDYVSKYRRVVDYFDAVKIGLTATPALHTTQIFGKPVVNYSYRRAVLDGFLVDHEPPIRIVTKLARDGIHYDVGEQVKTYDEGSDQVDLFYTEDEMHLEIDSFNRRVRTVEFNQAVCGELARHIDPSLPGKTLVFCVTDKHADMVVEELKEAFRQTYGEVDDDDVVKITGTTDKVNERISRYKNERMPSVAVTVDLLTTGIDVPEIVNLVFLRRVRSRILYEQMLGRGTRLCGNLGDDERKECFYVYDAVDMYGALESTMKPVAVDPSFTIGQVITQIVGLTDDHLLEGLRDQLIAKLRRKSQLINDLAGDHFEAVAGMTVDDLIEKLRREPIAATVEYLKKHRDLGEFLDERLPKPGQKIIISDETDEVVSVTQGYGKNSLPPGDYLEEFGQYINDKTNEIPALLIVTQRPRDLTRQQLRELQLALHRDGYNDRDLRAAWRATTNEDIAATIIGFIRQRALGDPLRPYDERVDAAVQRFLTRRAQAAQPLTKPQRRWLDRIVKQMKHETIVDREALNSGRFESDGGFERINRVFDGQLAKVLADLHDEVWKISA